MKWVWCIINVIFLDFDGVLDTIHYSSLDDIERRIKILSEICSELDCSVVIEASAKDVINEDTLQIEDNSSWVNFIFDCFDKYNINCIGRTPNVIRRINDYIYTPIWKEDEIRLYLYRHPEIDHYCIIDDDDFHDLEKVKSHLVKTIYSSNNYEEEGLLLKHKEEIKEILKKDNDIKRLILKKHEINKND